MATLRWLGRAAAVAQVSTLTIGGTIVAGDHFTVTCNGKSVTATASTTSTSTTASDIQAALVALSASLYPEFAEFPATVATNVVSLTASTAGIPFTVTVSTNSAAGTITLATPTAATGPNFWSDANNWDTAAVPVTGDTVYVEGSSVDILYGLDQSAVTLAALHVRASYTGSIGLAETNTTGSVNYPEYRDTYLKVGATVFQVGDGPGQGTGRLKVNTGTAQTTLVCNGTGSPAEQDIPAMLWKGTHASNAVTVNKGSFAAAWLGKETATVATLNVGHVTSPASDASVWCGNVTLTTVNQNGGDLTLNTGATTITRWAGTLTVKGTGALTTLYNWGGSVSWLSSGTLSALFVGVASIDYRGDMRAKIVSACDAYAGAAISDPKGCVTWSAGIDCNGCSLADVSLDVGKNVRITPGAVA